MSEQKLPPVWGVWLEKNQEYHSLHSTNEGAGRIDQSSGILGIVSRVVELIPREEADRMISDAIAAERERCAGILEDEARCDEMSGFHGKAAIFREFASKIREVTE